MRVPRLVIATLLAAPLPLVAQLPGERARLDSIHLRADAFTDSVSLLATEAARIAVARANREDPFVHMELGWIARRLGEITGNKSHYDDAAGEFEWASQLRPTWAYAFYWLGVCELDLGEARAPLIENIRQILGIDYLTKAVHAFSAAIAADPSFVDALVDLANTTIRQRARGRSAVALQAFRNAAATAASRSAIVWLARGRLERLAGDPDSAVYALHRYLETGGDRGLGGVELARSFAAAGQADSAIAAYQAALAPPVSDSARAEIRRDVFWVASPEQLRDFDALPGDSIEPFVRRFWDARDVDDARRPGERLLEQFRRYEYATQNFQLLSRRRAHNVAFVLHDTTQTELDDRGVIYMRHGAPTDRVRYRPNGAGAEPSETWRYRRQPPEQDLIFNFAPIGHVQDFRLIESLAPVCVQGRGSPDQRLLQERAGVPDQACFGARAGLAPIYDQLQRLPLGSSSFTEALANERVTMRLDAEKGVHTDSWRMTFAGDLLPVITTFVVGDTARRPQLHVVFAIPAGRLHAVTTAGAPGAVYPLQLRVLVFDSADRRIAGIDTVRAFHSAAPLGEGAYLTEQMVVTVPPGAWKAHILVAELPQREASGASGIEPANGQLVRGLAVDVPRMDSGFAVSDLVIGREASGLVWRAAEGEVPLNPLGVFPEGSAAVLYYEIYGLPQASSVETRVVIRPEGGSFLGRLFGRRGGVDLSYTTVTDAPLRARVRQRLELAGLRPGKYRLEVGFTDQVSGRHVVRADRLEIIGRTP